MLGEAPAEPLGKGSFPGVCVTARGGTGQLGHREKRFALHFGLELAFADRLLLVRCRIQIQNGNPGLRVKAGFARLCTLLSRFHF
jgi:hypothetical protein